MPGPTDESNRPNRIHNAIGSRGRAAPTRENFEPISNDEFSAMDDGQKLKLLGAAHGQIINDETARDVLLTWRKRGYAQARIDDREPDEIVVVIARNAPDERFFQDRPKLLPDERARLVESLSIEETAAYEALEPIPRMEFERDWATARWQWKRYAKDFFPDGKEWGAQWRYRDSFKDDPIYQDTRHPLNSLFREMTELAPDREDGALQIKYLVLAGNAASIQIGVEIPVPVVPTAAADIPLTGPDDSATDAEPEPAITG